MAYGINMKRKQKLADVGWMSTENCGIISVDIDYDGDWRESWMGREDKRLDQSVFDGQPTDILNAHRLLDGRIIFHRGEETSYHPESVESIWRKFTADGLTFDEFRERVDRGDDIEYFDPHDKDWVDVISINIDMARDMLDQYRMKPEDDDEWEECGFEECERWRHQMHATKDSPWSEWTMGKPDKEKKYPPLEFQRRKREVVPWAKETFPTDKPVWIDGVYARMVQDFDEKGVYFNGNIFYSFEDLLKNEKQINGEPCGRKL